MNNKTNFEVRQHGAMEFSIAPVDLNNVRKYRLQRLRKKMEGYGNDIASIRAYGLDVVTDLCGQLLDSGAPGLHFYTMNSSDLTTIIWGRLGLQEEAKLTN